MVGSTQVGFPTTVTEGELENTLDRQLGKTRAEELEREWVTQEPRMEDLDRNTEPSEDTTWEPKRFGVGTTTTKVTAMGENRRFLGGNSRGSDYHVTFIQNGMDHHEWDMESPPKGLGSHPRHTSQDSDLM